MQKFSQERRDEIYRAITLHRARYNMTLNELRADIYNETGERIDDSTMKRFLSRSKKTSEKNMLTLHLYAEAIPDLDPVYALGDGFAGFFELPETYAERKKYMVEMAALYEGRYRVWDVTSGTVDPDMPNAALWLTSQPGSAFLLAKESGVGRREDGAWWRAYEGIAIPRNNELTVFLKEVPVDHEKIYMLRCVTEEDSPGEGDGSALYGNAMQKRLMGDREADPKGPLADFMRILMRKDKPLTDEELDALEDDEVEEGEWVTLPEVDGFAEIVWQPNDKDEGGEKETNKDRPDQQD